MRARIYGPLAALTAFVGVVVVVTETRESSCAIICGWEVALAVAAVAAMFAIAALSVVAVVFEIRAWKAKSNA